MRLFSILFLFFAQISFSQVNLHGTLIVVIPGTDGIILACDSRMSSKPNDSIENSYYLDSINKTHFIDDMPIMIGGAMFHDCISIHEIIEKYKRIYKKENDKKLKFLNFVEYFRTNYPINATTETRLKNQFYTALYHDSIPYAIFTRDGEIVFSRLSIYASDINFLEFYPPNWLQCDSIAKILPQKFDNYRTKFGKSFDVGGPLSIIKILPDNSFIYIKNDFSKQKFNYKILHKILKEKGMGLFTKSNNTLPPEWEIEKIIQKCGQ